MEEHRTIILGSLKSKEFTGLSEYDSKKCCVWLTGVQAAPRTLTSAAATPRKAAGLVAAWCTRVHRIVFWVHIEMFLGWWQCYLLCWRKTWFHRRLLRDRNGVVLRHHILKPIQKTQNKRLWCQKRRKTAAAFCFSMSAATRLCSMQMSSFLCCFSKAFALPSSLSFSFSEENKDSNQIFSTDKLCRCHGFTPLFCSSFVTVRAKKIPQEGQQYNEWKTDKVVVQKPNE